MNDSLLNIKEDVFINYFKLSQKIQSFEQRLKSEEITPNARLIFHKELDTFHGSFDCLKQSALDVQTNAKQLFYQLEEMENQIIYLYRDIEERFEYHEISCISTKALELAKNFQDEDVVLTAKKINFLKHKISFLFKHRRPSMQHRKIIYLSLQLVNAINKTTQGKKNFGQVAIVLELLKKALAEANVVINPQEAEISIELCEIAELYAQKKEKEGHSKLKEIRYFLNEEQKNRLDGAFLQNKNMEKVLLKLAGADDIC